MLGDSLRRRHRAERKPPPESGKRPRPDRSPALWFPWWQWLLAAVAVLVISFGVGYLLSTQLLFPPPVTAGTGVPVPSLAGETHADAVAALRGVGLATGEVVELASTEIRRGRVLAQDPLPGQQLRRGATVSFAVSAGPPELRVPPLQGMSLESARELLEEVGFDVEVRYVSAEGVAADAVAGTEPPGGVARTLPATITLLVNEAVAEPPEDPPADTLPNGEPVEGRP